MKAVDIRNTTTVYACETCEKTFYNSFEATNCEEQHVCEHVECYHEFITASDDSWWFNVKGLSRRCKKCIKVLGEVYFENANDTQLMEMYNILFFKEERH